MKYADSLVLIVVVCGFFLLGLMSWYGNQLPEFTFLVFYELVPGGTMVSAIFTMSDFRQPLFRKQAIVALFLSALVFTLDVLLMWRVI